MTFPVLWSVVGASELKHYAARCEKAGAVDDKQLTFYAVEKDPQME